jgi:drug/metabolite transporter (DMT)-like permease
VLNSVGALCLVYAVRFGKAIIVVPMTALAPVLTIILSLILYRVVPNGGAGDGDDFGVAGDLPDGRVVSFPF